MKRLDIENTATGFIGGFTGHFIEDVLTSEAISTNFVTVDQDTRINVKIKADEETEINGNGPEVTEAQLQELLNILSSLTADDVVVFAGSAPSSLGNAVYKQLIAATRATYIHMGKELGFETFQPRNGTDWRAELTAILEE